MILDHRIWTEGQGVHEHKGGKKKKKKPNNLKNRETSCFTVYFME